MSLMNDMLKDLDRRGAGRDHDTLGDHHRTSHSSSAILWVMMAFGFIVLFAVVTALWWWMAPESPTRVIATETAPVHTETPVDSPEESATSTPRAQTVAAPRALDTEVIDRVLHEPRGSGRPTEPEPNVDNREQIETLLALARAARARDRLTRPVGDNAYEYYQQVLAIAPDEPEALAGLAAIAQRYRELAEAAMDRGSLAAARQFLQRARSVRPGAEGIQISEARLATLVDTTGPATETDSDAEPTTASTGGESSLSVRPDPASVDRRRADRAERLWSQGDTAQARALLETTLHEWSSAGVEPVESIGVLFELYLEADELGRARALLEQDRLPEDARVYRRAQLALANGQTGEALALLEAGARGAAQNEAYRALMARLFYEQQRFAEAAAHYRALLTDMGNRPAYWLGLGLAQDAQNDAPAALNAFRQALESGAYREDAAVRDYLQSRVDALTRRTQTQES